MRKATHILIAFALIIGLGACSGLAVKATYEYPAPVAAK